MSTRENIRLIAKTPLSSTTIVIAQGYFLVSENYV